MSISAAQIVKILQLSNVGRRITHKVIQESLNHQINNDDDLINYLYFLSENRKIARFPILTDKEINYAFKKGNEIVEKSYNSNIKIIGINDERFPTTLKNISDPPVILNYKGNIDILNESVGVAIIGTRAPTEAGMKAGKFFGTIFGERNFNIVSGLAIGCDSAAHRGAIIRGKSTAVLAHGLQMIYPKENYSLADDIIDTGGVLLSEYFFGTTALPNYFVERDRLQAGLSLATIVIQTDIKGGTMHAVNATIESNKILAAVSYSGSELQSSKTAGNQYLISQKNAFSLSSNNVQELIDKIILTTPNNLRDSIKTPTELSKNALPTSKVNIEKTEALIIEPISPKDQIPMIKENNLQVTSKVEDSENPIKNSFNGIDLIYDEIKDLQNQYLIDPNSNTKKKLVSKINEITKLFNLIKKQLSEKIGTNDLNLFNQ